MILPKAEKTPNNFSHWRHFYETHTPIVLSMTLVVAYQFWVYKIWVVFKGNFESFEMEEGDKND